MVTVGHVTGTGKGKEGTCAGEKRVVLRVTYPLCVFRGCAHKRNSSAALNLHVHRHSISKLDWTSHLRVVLHMLQLNRPCIPELVGSSALAMYSAKVPLANQCESVSPAWHGGWKTANAKSGPILRRTRAGRGHCSVAPQPLPCSCIFGFEFRVYRFYCAEVIFFSILIFPCVYGNFRILWVRFCSGRGLYS